MLHTYSPKTFWTGHLLKESCCYTAWYCGTLQNKIKFNILVPESWTCDTPLEGICISINFKYIIISTFIVQISKRKTSQSNVRCLTQKAAPDCCHPSIPSPHSSPQHTWKHLNTTDKSWNFNCSKNWMKVGFFSTTNIPLAFGSRVQFF